MIYAATQANYQKECMMLMFKNSRPWSCSQWLAFKQWGWKWLSARKNSSTSSRAKRTFSMLWACQSKFHLEALLIKGSNFYKTKLMNLNQLSAKSLIDSRLHMKVREPRKKMTLQQLTRKWEKTLRRGKRKLLAYRRKRKTSLENLLNKWRTKRKMRPSHTKKRMKIFRLMECQTADLSTNELWRELRKEWENLKTLSLAQVIKQ